MKKITLFKVFTVLLLIICYSFSYSVLAQDSDNTGKKIKIKILKKDKGNLTEIDTSIIIDEFQITSDIENIVDSILENLDIDIDIDFDIMDDLELDDVSKSSSYSFSYSSDDKGEKMKIIVIDDNNIFISDDSNDIDSVSKKSKVIKKVKIHDSDGDNQTIKIIITVDDEPEK
ncbi:MAG: hypothetical protein KAT68_16300 [Bacteroidales bacterium]|nr:hypothetical protein [Bacteroidales bacterium]